MSQTAETSPRRWPPQSQTPPAHCAHLLPGLPEPFSCSLSSTVALCGALRAPWRTSTILFQSGLKGEHKTPQLSCSDRNPTPAGPLRETRDVRTGKPWMMESTVPLSSGMLPSRSAANLRKEASATQARVVQVLRWEKEKKCEEGGQDWGMM